MLYRHFSPQALTQGGSTSTCFSTGAFVYVSIFPAVGLRVNNKLAPRIFTTRGEAAKLQQRIRRSNAIARHTDSPPQGGPLCDDGLQQFGAAPPADAAFVLQIYLWVSFVLYQK